MEQLAGFAAGDLGAFESLFRQFQGAVYGWIVRIVRDPAAAEDLTIETFWKIYRAHARFDPARSFGAWARRVAVNLALSYVVKARKGPTEPLEWDLPSDPRPDPCVGREQQEAIRAAFGSLPARLQSVASLALIEGMPYAEVAETLGISAAAVKSREFRAVKLLRKKLEHLGVNA